MHKINGDRREPRRDRHGRGEEEWFANSLSQAAFIYLAQVPLLRIDGKPGAPRFWFQDTGGIARRLADEYNNGGHVEACVFAQAIQQLKRQSVEILGRGAGYQGKTPASGRIDNPRPTEKNSETAFAAEFSRAMGEGQ